MVIPFGNQHASNGTKELTCSTPIESKPAKAPTTLTMALGSIEFLSSGLEDCEPTVEPEDFGKGGREGWEKSLSIIWS
jgi:hypothetical protein